MKDLNVKYRHLVILNREIPHDKVKSHWFYIVHVKSLEHENCKNIYLLLYTCLNQLNVYSCSRYIIVKCVCTKETILICE